MNRPKLSLLSTRGLFRHLEDICSDRLELGEFESASPRKQLWVPGRGSKEIEVVGKIPLYRELEDGEGNIVKRAFGDETETIGYFFVEKGTVCEEEDEEGTGYEIIKLRIKEDLPLKNGARLAARKTQVRAECLTYGVLDYHQKDHLQVFGFCWMRQRESAIPLNAFKAPELMARQIA